jgi:hypothetical protein
LSLRATSNYRLDRLHTRMLQSLLPLAAVVGCVYTPLEQRPPNNDMLFTSPACPLSVRSSLPRPAAPAQYSSQRRRLTAAAATPADRVDMHRRTVQTNGVVRTACDTTQRVFRSAHHCEARHALAPVLAGVAAPVAPQPASARGVCLGPLHLLSGAVGRLERRGDAHVRPVHGEHLHAVGTVGTQHQPHVRDGRFSGAPTPHRRVCKQHLAHTATPKLGQKRLGFALGGERGSGALTCWVAWARQRNASRQSRADSLW